MSKAGSIQLARGRPIQLMSIGQSQVYEGLLEGLPTEEMNKRIIDRAIAAASREDGREPYLLPPVQEPIEYRAGERYPFGTPAKLPSIRCVARFSSLRPARDTDKDYSSLTLIWFQEDFAFPIDPGVLDQIRALDWERHAFDYEY